MFARGRRTKTPRGRSAAAALDAAGARAGSSPKPSSPKVSSKFNSGCDTIALLNRSLLKPPIDSANRLVGRGFNNFHAAQVLGAARDFQRVAGLEAIVGADRHFDHLAGRLALDFAHQAFNRRYHRVRIGGGVDALLAHDGGHARNLLRELLTAFASRVVFAGRLMQLFGRIKSGLEEGVALLLRVANLFAQRDDLIAKPLVDLLS